MLDKPATVGDIVSEARSKELCNMILSCVAGGHALNTIEKVRDSNNGIKCGYLAWKALQDWYLDPTQVDSMITHWENKLSLTTLGIDTSATEYINNFEMHVRKLVKLGENWSDDKKVREFKKYVSDPDYDTEVRIHKGTFAHLVEIVRKREQDLGRLVLESSQKNKRARRAVKFDKDKDDESEDREKKNKVETPMGKEACVPFMPKFVFATFNSDAKTNFSKWRQLTNQGETMDRKHLVNTSLDEVVSGTKKLLKKTGKQKGKRTHCVTRIQRVGI